MTPDELAQLTFFRDGERYLNGMPVEWSSVDAKTMQAIDHLRGYLDSPIKLIRGAHPHQATAVDACCPGRSLASVYLALTRLSSASWGIYSGNSFHLDNRAVSTWPARWMAIRESEVPALHAEKLSDLIAYSSNGWIYLKYNHELSLRGVAFVCDLSERHRGRSDQWA